MTDLPETHKALAATVSDMLAVEIANVRKEAARNEEIRTLEHRAFMAETRETLAGMQRQIDDRLATVKDGRDGVDGRDGRDGRDADMEQLSKQVADMVAAIPVPVDGKDGRDGIDGKDGLSGVDGKDGRDGVDGKDGVDGADGKDADMDALRTHLAELVAAIPVPADGKDGRDGVDGKDAYPGEVKGVFSEEETYRARDIVAHNGASWIARRDEPGELPGEGWMQLAYRGKRGDRGEPGKEGQKGETGPAIIEAYADPDAMELVLVRDDGQEVKADLYKLATVIKGAS